MEKVVSPMKWNAGLYDQKHDFVFRFGEDVVALLDPKPGEWVLDLGCGTGYLTHVIAAKGAHVIGIDNSEEMINKALADYPDLEFEVEDAASFQLKRSFDAVFSNAALHWMLDKERVVKSVFKHLKSGGRFVLEMGARENIQHIITALRQVLASHGYRAQAGKQIWYFPSLGEYASLLEKNGFVVHYATYFRRDTELKDSENGIIEWIRMFASEFLIGIGDTEVRSMMEEVQQLLKPLIYRNNKWYADYQRLRIVAAKP